MSFQAVDDFFDQGLSLPVRGKTYRIAPPDAETGLHVQRVMALTQKRARLAVKQRVLVEKEKDGRPILASDRVTEADELTAAELKLLQLDDAAEDSLYRRVLGPVFDELMADKVNFEMLKHVGVTATIWINGDEAAAERYWNSAGSSPEAPAPNRESRRASKASGSSTRPPASTSGTRTRKK